MPQAPRPESGSFVKFARSRYRLAGGEMLAVRDPWFLPVDEWQASLAAQGRAGVNFAHYDYLGLNRHPDVEAAAIAALQTHGTSVSASRLVGGERSLNRTLEHALANHLGRDAALVLVSGYLTNVSILHHVTGARNLIVYDELSHNSIVTGIAAAKAHAVSFPHNDLHALDALLAECRGQYRRCLIVAESLYSMDGDIVDLPRLIEIKRRNDCWLMLDEAHSIGVLGATGRGLCEHYGVDPAEIDILIGTLSKTFVSCGGFVAANADVIRWLKYTLPGFVYSVGIPPASAAAALAALTIAAAEPQRVARLRELSEFFLAEARRRGLNTGQAIGRGVVPLLFDGDMQAIAVSDVLAAAGIYVPPIVRIGVPKDKPRLRFFMSANHRPNDILRALDIVAGAAATQPHANASKPPITTATGLPLERL